MFFAGLDIHTKFIYATIIDEKAAIVKQGKFSTREKELMEFLEFMPNKQVKIVLESCGIWQDIYEILEGKGYDVILANPYKVKLIASAKIKTDKVDSESLARLLKGNLIPETYVPAKNIRELRDFVRHRQVLVKVRTVLKNQIHAILRRRNIVPIYDDIFTIKARKYLLSMQDPKINTYLKIIESLNKDIYDVKKLICQIPDYKKQAELLKSMVGIGDIASYMILAEIGDITRFSSPEKLCSYAGIVPSISQSGNKSYNYGITKQGSKWLRWILIQCCHAAVQKQCRFQRFYYHLSSKKPKSVAMTATARKMLVYIWYMLTYNQPYHDDYTSLCNKAMAPRSRAEPIVR
jgi:transposase